MAFLQQMIVMILLSTSSTLWITQSLANEYYGDYDPYYQSMDYYHYYDPYYQAPVYYTFDWSVKDVPSGNDYGQKESRDGHLTTGLYHVLLPDGRHQSVNYRVDKDSGFIADVSYQGEANYYSFKSSYEPKTKKQPVASSAADAYVQSPPPPSPSYAHYYAEEEPQKVAYYQQPSSPADDNDDDSRYPQLYTYDGAPAYNYAPPEPASYYHEAAYSVQQPSTYPTTTPTRRPPTRPSYNNERKKPATATTTTTTTTPAPVTTQMSYDSPADYTVPSQPLYRIDFYSARAKAGKTIPDPTGGYAVDETGNTYIKADNSYFAPEKLGTYEIKHRKATSRKPSGSDYKTPDSFKMNRRKK